MRAERQSNKNCGSCGYCGLADDPKLVRGKCSHPEAPEDETVALSDYCADWKGYEMPKEQRKRLPWEYCECGCKGWNLDIGGVYFHLYWDLKDTWLLSDKHGVSMNRKKYNSAPEAEAVVKEALAEALCDRNSERAAIKLVLEESNG
jgi:hypothetical protein